MTRPACLSAIALVTVAACSGEDAALPPPLSPSAVSGVSGVTTGAGGGGGGDGGGGGGMMAPFEVSSPAFGEGDTIPTPHECGAPIAMGPGENVTPELSWTPGPAGTQSYAIIVRDVDAMVGPFPDGIIHWAIYDIPATATSLPEGIGASAEVAEVPGAKQAEIQGSGYFGYFGPCSPSSINTYVFTVHAMGEPVLDLGAEPSEMDVADLVESTSIASTSLSGES